jgi:hypothetical protein
VIDTGMTQVYLRRVEAFSSVWNASTDGGQRAKAGEKAQGFQMRRPPSPSEQARRIAWGTRWGAANSAAAQRLEAR